MKSIVLIDTSIFCEVLDVPLMASRRVEVLAQFRRWIDEGAFFLLPTASILETGNHIAQHGDGNLRRSVAERFVEQVCDAITGKSPFVPTAPLDVDELQRWLLEFPDCAMRGVGLGDLSIIKEWELQRERNAARRVLIWSLDEHLAGYDTGER